MTGKVILTDEQRAQLTGLDQVAEVCEASGSPIGYYVPHDEYMKWQYALAKTAVPLDELKRRLAAPGGMSLAEAWVKIGVKP